jgi:hypothetical protein
VAADGRGSRIRGRDAVPILQPGSSELAAGVVPFAELDHLGIFVVDIVVRLFLADERLRYLVQITVRRLEDKIDRLTPQQQRALGDRGQLLDQDVHPDQDHSHALPSPSRSRS